MRTVSEKTADRRDPRFDRGRAPTVRSCRPLAPAELQRIRPDAVVDCAWGRVLFAHTFRRPQALLEALRQEAPGERDVAIYLRDPHVVLSLSPQELFLDPSHTFRLWLDRYRPAADPARGFEVRRVQTLRDAREISGLYERRHMVPVDPDRVVGCDPGAQPTWFIARDPDRGRLIGAVCAIDHRDAFDDPEGGASLWSLAADPESPVPGVGEALVRRVAEHHLARGNAYVDLSVLHDNAEAISLYEKLGFVRVPAFCVKLKNTINESLYAAPAPDEDMNPYAQIIVDEARRRGIDVEIVDAGGGFFRLRHGGRSVLCRESLSDLTSAVALSLADDKRATRRLLAQAGFSVPDQIDATEPDDVRRFLERHERVVVKPRRGEQGRGVAVDLRTIGEVEYAIAAAGPREGVLVEQLAEGDDLRVVVIGGEAVAAAVRRPPLIVGTGHHSIRRLIEKLDRRRAAATAGESRVRIDGEVERCLAHAGFSPGDVLPAGKHLNVRRTANLHTGGTLEDVTATCHPELLAAAVGVAGTLGLPVCGVDLLVTDHRSPEHVIIEANERPGLANHEPQPTAERFVDLLFPPTVPSRGR